MRKTTAKRLLASLLAVVLAAGTLAGCSKKEEFDEDGNPIIVEEDKGAEITSYIAANPNDLDPGRAYYNADLGKYYSLIYEGLFKIDEKGKLSKALASEYEYDTDERDGKLKLTIKLRSTSWSDGIAVDADDVVYAYKRLLDPANSNPAVSLLYPIENAKEAKAGLCQIEDVGVSAINSKVIEYVFEEGYTDVEHFLRNLASPILIPLREDVITTNGYDWAQPMFLKKSRDGEDTMSTYVTNGPFAIKNWDEELLVLERSTYYRNLNSEQKVTTYVRPYRLVLNFTKNLDDQIEKYNNDAEFYIADFTNESYAEYEKKIKSYPNNSAYTYYLNCDDPLLSSADVRRALSMSLDREHIAEIMANGADPATGFVPTGIEADDSGKKMYRGTAPEVISIKPDIEGAKALVKNAKKGELTITIRNGADDEHDVALYAKEAWEQLGFKVKLKTLSDKSTKDSEISEYEKALTGGDFQIIGLDICGLSTDAQYFLAPYARDFSGSTISVADDAEPSAKHITNFENKEYNELIEKLLTAANAKERLEIYEQAEAKLSEEMPAIPLTFGNNAYLTSNKVSGVKYTFFGTPIFNSAKLKNYKKYKVAELDEEE